MISSASSNVRRSRRDLAGDVRAQSNWNVDAAERAAPAAVGVTAGASQRRVTNQFRITFRADRLA